jgi:hypothetical protein
MEVLIGVDPHKATNVLAAVDEQGGLVGQENFPANHRKGMRALERWANGFPQRRPKPWRAPAASVAHWHTSSWPEASAWWT